MSKTKTSWSKTFIFVLEAPQDQDPGLEDYITGQQVHADIQTNVMISEKPAEFWLNSCPKPYSQLSVLAVDLLAAPASQAIVERLFSLWNV